MEQWWTVLLRRVCFRIEIQSQGGEEVTHQVHTLEIGGANPFPATNPAPIDQMVRSSACHAEGQGFESPTVRQFETMIVDCNLLS